MKLIYLAMLGACGGSVGGSTDVEPTLVFANLDDTTISRIASAASASDGFGAQSVAGSFDDPFDDDPCPAVVEDAATNTVTITGGCTTLDDQQIEGSIVIHNPLGFGELDYDFTSDSVYEFDGFTMVLSEAAGIVQAWDGVFTTGPSFETLDLDLTTELQAITVRSDLFLACDQTSRSCEYGESGVELLGSGGALVSGTVSVGGQTASTSLTLRGADTLEFSIVDSSCLRWNIVGTDRSFQQGTCE